MLATLVSLMALAPSIHVCVDGEGYMRFVRDGRAVYAKEADLAVRDGRLSSQAGPSLNPRIQVASDVTELRIETDGRVIGVSLSAQSEIGRIVLAVFPDDVRLVVDNSFLVSSYRPEIVVPGSTGAGVVRTVSESVAATTTITNATTPIEIQLRERVEVAGASFTLGEIATIVGDAAWQRKLGALEVSKTPALGVPFSMSQETVRTRLLRHGKEAEQYKFSGSNQVTVTRRGQSVSHAMFVQAATAAARAQIGADTALSAGAIGATVVAPLGRLELVGEQVSVSGTQVSVRVAIMVDGERINSRTVTLEKGGALSKLRVGQTVKLLVRSGAATVETTGRVRSIDQATGLISVMAATGAELVGKAVAPDTVEVVL